LERGLMSRKLIPGLLGLLALSALTVLWLSVVLRASAAPPGPDDPGSMPPQRERQGEPEAPLISFIDSPTAQCYQPEPHKDTCYIQWYYLNVTATSPQYIISMTVSIDNRKRAYYGGFFQTSMYVPQEMSSPGFRVACGPPGASGVPDWGASHTYVIRAKETGGLKAANYGSVYCPADIVPVAAVSLAGPLAGSTGITYPFTATVSPITATLPVTYAWSASEQTAITATGGITGVQSFAWSSPGEKQVVVTAFNPAGTATVTHTITVETPISGLAASSESPTILGDATHLTATVAAGSNVVYAWDLGDGDTAAGPAVSHTYPTAGVYTATVSASNGVSAETASTTVIIDGPSGLPLTKHAYLPLLLRAPGTGANGSGQSAPVGRLPELVEVLPR